MTRKELLQKAFKFSMKEEGGDKYTNDPRDPGGPTKYGVCLTYNRVAIGDRNKDGKIDAEDVKLLTEEDAMKIYRERYFDAWKCGEFPPAIAFLMADMVYNPGPGATPILLAKALNALGCNFYEGGGLHNKLISASYEVDRRKLVEQLSEKRLAYYRSRKGWPTYGRGWTNRTNRCRDAALKLVGEEWS